MGALSNTSTQLQEKLWRNKVQSRVSLIENVIFGKNNLNLESSSWNFYNPFNNWMIRYFSIILVLMEFIYRAFKIILKICSYEPFSQISNINALFSLNQFLSFFSNRLMKRYDIEIRVQEISLFPIIKKHEYQWRV